MATRSKKNPELAAAASNIADAAQHIRRAVGKKFDQIGASASAEIGKAKKAALTKRGQAERKFDALLKSAEVRLTRATNEAKRSLHRAVREAEKKLQATKKAVESRLTELHLIGKGKPAAKKAAVKKTPATKAAVKQAPAKKAAAKKAPAKKVAVRKAAARKSAG